MKKLLKDNLVKRIVFSGIVLIFVYWIFNNLAMFGSVIGNFVGIIMPFITGLVIAFIFNVPMRFIEKHLFKGEKFEKKKEDFKNDAAASALHRACDPERLRRDQRQRGRRRHPVGSG